MSDDYTPAVQTYSRGLFAPEDEALTGIGPAATAAGLPAISIGPEEGRFLQVVAAAVGARRALEIGTLAGYSGVWIARALGPEGRLVTLEFDPHHAAVAAQNFERAGLADQVEIHIGAALDLLPALASEPPFDLVFIDADKESYPEYLDWALKLCRPGAAILAHNVYLGGSIATADGSPRNTAVRAFNQRLSDDPRLDAMLVPLRDGMSLAVVRDR